MMSHRFGWSSAPEAVALDPVSARPPRIGLTIGQSAGLVKWLAVAS